MPRSAPCPAAIVRLLMPGVLGLAALSACSDRDPVGSSYGPDPLPPVSAIQAVECAGTTSGSLSCTSPEGSAGGGAMTIIGGQNVNLRLTSSNVSYDSVTEIFQFDVTVQNLLNEAIGTPDGSVPDPDGIQVFFGNGPTVTSGTGSISVANADGTGTFTAADQPYFAYHAILTRNAVSPAKTWQLEMPPTVETFAFTVYVETDTQYLLVFNELLANPGGTISDANGEWLELYNAGSLSVNLQNLVIADSAASGRRPYHLISQSLLVPPGGYVVLGNTTNTTNNGGVPVDYAYVNALAFANSLDAAKISRVYGTDTLTIDRTQYANPGISAPNGVSRELTNPALDNANMDGGNWANAPVGSDYGPGGRGTPGAQNANFTP